MPPIGYIKYNPWNLIIMGAIWVLSMILLKISREEGLGKARALLLVLIIGCGIGLALMAFGLDFLKKKGTDPAAEYSQAVELMNSGDYEGANAKFVMLGDYEKSAEYTDLCNAELDLQIAEAGRKEVVMNTVKTDLERLEAAGFQTNFPKLRAVLEQALALRGCSWRSNVQDLGGLGKRIYCAKVDEYGTAYSGTYDPDKNNDISDYDFRGKICYFNGDLYSVEDTYNSKDLFFLEDHVEQKSSHTGKTIELYPID